MCESWLIWPSPDTSKTTGDESQLAWAAPDICPLLSFPCFHPRYRRVPLPLLPAPLRELAWFLSMPVRAGLPAGAQQPLLCG